MDLVSDYQTPEELDAHFGPSGPVAAARLWLRSVLVDGDYEAAWELMDENHRLCRAQAWIHNNREASDISPLRVEALNEERRNDIATAFVRRLGIFEDLWQSFAATEIDLMRQAWRGVDPAELRAGSRTRILGTGLELVIFLPPGAVELVEKPTMVTTTARFVMHHVEGRWLVAALSDRLPEPGWPPLF